VLAVAHLRPHVEQLGTLLTRHESNTSVVLTEKALQLGAVT
jgi:hypothetical protein